ncbi:MAG: prolyl oligopeptidase family serine peptidase [Bacteroidales bacterium]
MKHYLLFSIIILFNLHLSGQSQFEGKTFTSKKGTNINYRELKPEAQNHDQSFPLVIFMHGAGERGSDNTKQLTHGAKMFENPVNREKYPAYVLFPQCPEAGYWAYNQRPISFVPDSMPITASPTPLIETISELISSYSQMPEIDANRIYIIGISMGAMATYDLVGRYPELFTAAIPICGTVNSRRLANIQNVKFRIFHGDEDYVVPVDGSREAYKALKNKGVQVEYFEMPGINHGSWNPAFNQPDFMSWLFSQTKNEEIEIPNLD